MFDSREYQFSDLSLVVQGRDITGIRGIKYTEKIEREALFAKGKFAHSIQSGNVSVEGEITVTQSEYEALVTSGKGSVLNLKNLTAMCSYGDLSSGDPVINDSIEGIYFTEGAKQFKQGDKFMEVTLPFLALRVNKQVS